MFVPPLLLAAFSYPIVYSQTVNIFLLPSQKVVVYAYPDRTAILSLEGAVTLQERAALREDGSLVCGPRLEREMRKWMCTVERVHLSPSEAAVILRFPVVGKRLVQIPRVVNREF